MDGEIKGRWREREGKDIDGERGGEEEGDKGGGERKIQIKRDKEVEEERERYMEREDGNRGRGRRVGEKVEGRLDINWTRSSSLFWQEFT